MAAAATMATALSPGAASAAAEPHPVELQSHCVVYVVDQAEDGEMRTSRPTCYATEKAAAEAAAEPFLKPQAADLDARSFGYSSFTIGRHYDGYNGTGSSITVVGSSCTGGYWNTPTWFDNKTSSSYNGCYRLRHYDRPNRGGSATDTYGAGTTDNLAAWMNNRTESVAYFSS